MDYFVNRQHYWGVEEDDAFVVEIAQGGRDFANADMLTPKWANLGEGKEYTDIREAVEVAIRVCQAWRDAGEVRAQIGMGYTGGGTLPFEPMSFEDARAKAEQIYQKAPKCDQCGDLLDEGETYSHPLSDDERFCSEGCAEDNYSAAYSVVIDDDMINNAIQESLGGISSEHCATLRSKGISDQTLPVQVPLVQIQERAQSRLDGLPSDAPHTLTLEELRQKLGVSPTTQYYTLQVQVPLPRRAMHRYEEE